MRVRARSAIGVSAMYNLSMQWQGQVGKSGLEQGAVVERAGWMRLYVTIFLVIGTV